MGIGEHQAPGGIDHHPGSLAPLPHRAGRVPEEVPQQGVEEGRVKGLASHIPLGVESHHRGANPAGRIGDETVLRRLRRPFSRHQGLQASGLQGADEQHGQADQQAMKGPTQVGEASER